MSVPIAAGITPAWQARRPAKRPRRMGLCSEVADDGENLEDHPAFASRYVCRKAPVSAGKLAGEFVPSGVEPFSFRPDKILPGTLHHSGNRPAPPSDHTPLARRSAFQRRRKRGRRGNSNARAGLERIQRVDFCRADARRNAFAGRWNMELCGSAPVIAEACGRFP